MVMKHYLSEAEDVLKSLNAAQEGITSEEAGKREEKYGKNKLQEAKKTSIIKRFLQQLADPMIIILIVAAIISAVTATIEGGEGYADVIIIMVVVLTSNSGGHSGKQSRGSDRSIAENVCGNEQSPPRWTDRSNQK